MAEQYCFPERNSMFPQNGYEYQITKPAGSMYDIMKIVGALPDTSELLKDAVLASGNNFKIFYDLSATALTLEIGAKSVLGQISHIVSTSESDDGNIVSMEAMFKGLREYEMKIIYTDESDVKTTTTMVYTYPMEVSPKGTMDNWFVTYAFDEDGQLEVYLSNDYEGLRAEDSKLETTDKFPSDAWMFMETLLEPSAMRGSYLKLGMGADHAADSKITFHYPIPGDSIKPTDIAIIGFKEESNHYILQRQTFPGNSPANPLPSYWIHECVDTSNYMYTDVVSSGNSQCPSNPHTLRVADTKMPFFDYWHYESGCAESDLTCWEPVTKTCFADQTHVCSISEADALVMATDEHIQVGVYDVGPLDAIKLAPGDTGNQYKVIFLGEKLDLSCTDTDADGVKYVFEYNSEKFMDKSQFGYDTISFSCVNDYDQKYTDFKAIFDALKCIPLSEVQPDDDVDDGGNDDGQDDDCAATFSCEYSQAAIITSSSAIITVFLVVALF